MPDIFPESRDEAILLSMINGEEYTGFPESRIEVLLLQLKATLEDWKSKTKGAYVFHGSVEFSELPSTLTEDMVGWTYNMLEEFTTDDRFVDGAGKVYPAGTNVVIANVGTDETPVLKFDVTSAFVDVNAIYSAIDNIADMIADEFDEDEAYAVGDIVWYVDDLYTFVSPHTAGDPWSNLEVNMTTVDEIINAVYADINSTISDIEGMIANQFNAATAYSEDDYVIYQNGLYKFTSDHEAGAAWDPSIVSSIDVMAAIKQAESDLATLSGYFAAMTDTVSDLEDQVDMIQEAIETEKTVSGNPIVITDALALPATSLITEIEAIQDLHGLPFPYVGGAYKNKLPMTVESIKAANIDGTWSGNDYTFRDVTWTIITDNADNVVAIKANGTASGGLSVLTIMPNTPNTYNGMILNGGVSSSCRLQMFNQTTGTDQINSTGSDVTIPFANGDVCRVSAIVNNTTTANNELFYPMIRLSTESDADFAPYSNICPISGRTEVTVNRSDGDEISEDFTIQLGQTVYGADINWDTGVATVTHKEVTMDGVTSGKKFDFKGSGSGNNYYFGLPDGYLFGGTARWISSNELKQHGMINSHFPYSETDTDIGFKVYVGSGGTVLQPRLQFGADSTITTIELANQWLQAQATAGTPWQFVYPLATPTTIQLTPTQLQMLKGYNRVSIEDGTITLTYKANKADSVQAEVDALDANKAEKTTIAPVENGTKASQAYTIGKHFIRDNKFCTAIAAISSGATLTKNTNYKEGDINDSIFSDTNIVVSQDLNNYTKAGVYRIESSVTNAPVAWCNMLVFNNGSDITQMIVKTNGTIGEIYIRTYDGNPKSWKQWFKISGTAV